MADFAAHSPWTSSKDAFSFESELPTRIPRGWERAPKSPYGGRHGGRKVWKRYDNARKDRDEDTKEKGSGPALEDTTNTSHTAKRLRLKEGPEISIGGKENKPTKYLATLRDKAQSTPRRKLASRKSSESDNAKLRQQGANTLNTAEPSASGDVVQEDVLRASQSPVLEAVRELLGSDDYKGDTTDNESQRIRNEVLTDAEKEEICEFGVTDPPEGPTLEAPMALVERQSNSSAPEDTIQETLVADSIESPVSSIARNATTTDTPKAAAPSQPTKDTSHMPLPTELPINKQTITSPLGLEANIKTPKQTQLHSEIKALSVNAMSSSQSTKRHPNEVLDALSAEGSPQIGASLLRRESLRRKGNPINKRELRKTRSPKKRDTLSRRDTLQEREVLQKVISETSQISQMRNFENPMLEAAASSDDQPCLNTEESARNEQHASPKLETNESQRTLCISDAESSLEYTRDAKTEDDLHEVSDANEVFEQPQTDYVRGDPLSLLTDDTVEMSALEEAIEVTRKANNEETTQTTDPLEAQAESPTRKLRSGARFSDDTNMLRDFLSRAQASKAAKTPILSPLDAPEPQTSSSPRRLPRKALGSHKGKSMVASPRKSEDIATGSGTPTGRTRSDNLESDDTDECTVTPTSCRRSTRTRLPATPKAPPGAPSFIPVRRADGTDPVVLQKSQAQELAMVTRANTRRNKGHSKPPLLALKDIPMDTTEIALAKQRSDTDKAVGWAKAIASYQEAKEAQDESEESKPKVRRMRGLSAANGTPAPAKKSTAVVGPPNGTPAPKRRGKAMPGK